MGLFGLFKKEKEAWIAIVIQGKKSGMQIDEALLKNATEIYITQHIRIIEDRLCFSHELLCSNCGDIIRHTASGF